MDALRRLLALRIDLRRWTRALGISLAVWSAGWLVLGLQAWMGSRAKGLPAPTTQLIGIFLDFMVWAFFTPALIAFIWKIPLTRATWPRRLLLHAVTGVLISAALMAPIVGVRALARVLLDRPEIYVEVTVPMLLRWVASNLFMYIDVILCAHAIHYAREARAKDLQAAQLSAQLAQAQLDALKMQLHPHFLFNTLHSISTLMHRDVEAADQMITRLGDLLRITLDRGSSHLVSLRQELEFLEGYLEIERTRFRDRLTVRVEVDPDAYDVEVPNLILQPLVENAIRHGVAKRSTPGQIQLRARREGDRLVLQLADDGPGLPMNAERALRNGVGLANTQARLRQLYGDRHVFELHNRPGGGLEVTLAFPARSDEASAAAPVPSTEPAAAPATPALPRQA